MGESWREQVRFLLSVVATAVFLIAGVPAVASASVSPQWLVKGQDVAPWDNAGTMSAGLAAQASQDGVSLPRFTWQTCGTYRGVTYGYSDYTACQPGRTLVAESFTALAAAVHAGVFRRTGMATALLDLESWSFSGTESADPARWIRRAITFARLRHIGVIVTVGGRLATCWACMTAAARAGAVAVSVQNQGKITVGSWDRRLSGAVRAVAGTGTPVIAGLATNTPGVHSLTLLQAEYASALRMGVTRFWLNANNWGARNQCGQIYGGPGCPEIGVQFLGQPGSGGG